MTADRMSNLELHFSRFFSAPNKLHWANRSSGPQSAVFSQHVEPWIELFARFPDQNPLVLPYYEDSGLTDLYVGAANAEVGYALVDELMAFLGNTYAKFMPHEPLQKREGGINGAFMELCPARAFRLQCGFGVDESRFWRVVGEYLAMLKERPEVKKLESRPFGRIQHDLDEAVQVGDERLAREFLAELHLTGRLNATNKKFLEIKILAGVGRWAAITDTPILRDVIDGLVMPINVHSAVLTAIYRRYFSEFEEKNDVDSALDLYRGRVGALHAKALETRRGVRTADVVKLFLVKEVASSDPDWDICGLLASNLPVVDRQTAFVRGLLDRVKSIAIPQRSLCRAQNAFDEGRYETAFGILVGLGQNPETLSLLVEVASDDGSVGLAKRTIKVLEECGTDIINALTPRLKAKVQRLREVSGSSVQDDSVSDWVDWCRLVKKDCDDKAVVAIASDCLSRGNWNSSEFATTVDRVAQFADWIVKNDRRDIVEKLFPEMCAFHCYGSYREEFRPIYRSLFEHAVLEGEIGTSRLQNIYELVRCIFESGVDTKAYIDLVEGIRVLLDSTDGIIHLDWRLDLAELLAVYPCPDNNARSTIASEMASRLGELAHRILPSQWAQLELFGIDFGLSDHIRSIRPVHDEGSQGQVVTEPQMVGIYSLMDGVAHRAGEVLKRIVDGLVVETNTDKVATNQLRSLVESVDFFVFAWRAASHPAFDCVKKYVRSEDRLLLPSGKGSSSIVRCVLEALGVH